MKGKTINSHSSLLCWYGPLSTFIKIEITVKIKERIYYSNLKVTFSLKNFLYYLNDLQPEEKGEGITDFSMLGKTVLLRFGTCHHFYCIC